MREPDSWAPGTWAGARYAQMERSLHLTVRERLEAMEGLAETSHRIAEAARASGGAGPPGQPTATLRGCRPTPLADYLKALGVLRLVGEQKDPAARGWWHADTFHIRSRMDEPGLIAFFRDEYRPTAILAPWNGGSGFYPGDNQSGIGPIADGSAPRLEALRTAIRSVRAVLEREGLSESPDKEQKEALLTALRAELADAALRWMDAAVILLDKGSRYPPLLGTGGNDGRLDFTNNFLQRLVSLMDPGTGAATDLSGPLLEEALFGRAVPHMAGSAIGQFSPTAAGGPNAATSFAGRALVNPWDFVLMLEGALLFAAAATRRLEVDGDGGAFSYPFTVRPSGSGSGGLAFTDEGTSRGEIWMPLWARPATHGEVALLMGEGRATVGRRAARDGLDFARAVATLGIARGVHEFQRFGFLQRYGRTYLATPLNRVPVRSNRAASLIDQLERRDWLARFRGLARPAEASARVRGLARRAEASARVASLARRVDDGLFDLALRGTPSSAQRVLVALGDAMQYLAVSPRARERCGPVPMLDEVWVTAADDATDEFRIARALAGLHGASGGAGGGGSRSLPLISHIAPVRGDRRQEWAASASRDVLWGPRPVEANLGLVLQRWLVHAHGESPPGEQGADRPWDGWCSAPLDAVSRWLDDDLDTARIARLTPGLALARARSDEGPTVVTGDRALPGAYRLLKPFFCTLRQLRRVRFLADDAALPFPMEVVRYLMLNHVDRAVALAAERLRIRGFPTPRHLQPRFSHGPRLLAALLVPLGDRDLSTVLRPLRRRG